MGPAIRFCSAVALLGRFPVLAGVDLHVDRGEVVLLSGPNGAGKTTLLRACAGLVAITSGRAEVLGHDLRADRRAVRSAVGLLGHAAFLYDELTVEDNVRFATRAARAPKAAVEPALSRLGLDGRLRRVPAARLSAGQRRRVALAVLVARWPELWLLDEPHAGLDANGRDLVDGIVREAVAGGATALLASHELDRAGALADRALTVVGGRVLPAGADEVAGPSGIPAAPADTAAGAARAARSAGDPVEAADAGDRRDERALAARVP